MRDCVMQDDEARCKEVGHYIHSFWKNLHVKSGCLCVDERVAIPNSIKDALLESIHMAHPGRWGWSPYPNTHGGPTFIGKFSLKLLIVFRAQILVRTSNLKPIIPKSKWHPHKLCQEPNEEIQIDIGGPILNEKEKEIYFLTCIDRYSKYPTVKIFEKANGTNVVKFLRE